MRRTILIVATVVLLFSLGCALSAAVSGLGHKWGWWNFRAGFSLLRWSAYAALTVIGLALLVAIFAWLRQMWLSLTAALVGVALGVTTIALPWSYLRLARSLPPIHDITTDTGDPPEFVSVLELRADAPNPAVYAGAAIAEQQQRAYPDLKPLQIELSPADVLAHAVDVGKSMNWEIVAAVPLEGRLEATATTFWFGFKDDVVVRITPSDGGSRVDVRSVSRVGRSDVGANARRIRTFLKKLDARIGLKWAQ
jgi:uncharacterized protein (DUF1499 family)